MSYNWATMKIAITHDYLTEYGGAEMVLWELLKTFPEADLYTPILRPTKKQRAFWNEVSRHKVYSTILSGLPIPKVAFKLLLPVQIRFFKRLDLSKYDAVISSSAGFAKFINTENKTKHIAYIHTPSRFLWGYETSVFHKIPGLVRLIFSPILSGWRKQDRKFAQKADLVVANSKNIQNKIKTVYQRDSQLIYPPVGIDDLLGLSKQSKQDYFLTIGRLYEYKRVDLIVEAFSQLDEKLVVIGDGPQRKNLEEISGKNVEFRGFVDEDVKIKLLQKAKGFVFAAEEDFGIVMVEALAAGTPVIAYHKGGASEIVEDGINGLLFQEQNRDSIKTSLEKFREQKFDQEKVKNSARKFSSEKFRSRIKEIVEDLS
ncbi:glycosyltransferase [Candidatus Dojkabacteria bacterium]|nr:glycosyltransferase [Candidatus Dojkabacteria bacterium]